MMKANDVSFVDVPALFESGSVHNAYPGLLENIDEIRERDFPLFSKLGRVYLDSGATSQEPQSVKDAMHNYRSTHLRGSNHSRNSAEARGAQEKYEQAKEHLQNFFGAHDSYVALTSGTTETSNTIGTWFPFEAGDLLLIPEMEHNSQILTARNFARKAGAEVKYVPCRKDGTLDLDKLAEIVDKGNHGKTLLNLVHVSNVSGAINPVNEIRDIIGDDAYIYLDMAQSAPHMPINLDEFGVDYAGLSAHKMYGPMGIGAMFINKNSADVLNNSVSGGSAVKLVSRHFDVPSDAPAKFEPGTQNLEGCIEWMFALEYLDKIGMQNIEAHERELGKYFLEELQKIDGIRIYGPKDFDKRAAVVTFNVGSFANKNYDVLARELDKRGISVRDGCFCAHIYTAKLLGLPGFVHEGRTAMMKLGISSDLLKLPGAVRASFAFYNDLEDAYKAVCAIKDLAAEYKGKYFL